MRIFIEIMIISESHWLQLIKNFLIKKFVVKFKARPQKLKVNQKLSLNFTFVNNFFLLLLKSCSFLIAAVKKKL